MNTIATIALYAFLGLCMLWVYWILSVTLAMFLDAPEWVGYVLLPVFLSVCALIGWAGMTVLGA